MSAPLIFLEEAIVSVKCGRFAGHLDERDISRALGQEHPIILPDEKVDAGQRFRAIHVKTPE